MRHAAAVCAWTLLTTILSMLSWAGEIRGQIVMVRQTTKRHVAAPLYSMRAGILASREPSVRAVTEAEKVVLYLEGEGLERAEPVKARLEQKDAHFNPEILVVPAGSTVSFPNLD